MKKYKVIISIIFSIMAMLFYQINTFGEITEEIRVYVLKYDEFYNLISCSEKNVFDDNYKEYKIEKLWDSIENKEKLKCYDEFGYVDLSEIRYNNILLSDLRNLITAENITRLIYEEKNLNVNIVQTKVLDVYREVGIQLIVYVETTEGVFLLELKNDNDEGGKVFSTANSEEETLKINVLSVEESIEKYRVNEGCLYIGETRTEVKIEYQNIIPKIPLVQTLKKVGIKVEKKPLYKIVEGMKNDKCIFLSKDSKKLFLYGEEEINYFCEYEPERYSEKISNLQMSNIIEDGECYVYIATLQKILNKFCLRVENEINERSLKVVDGKGAVFFAGETIKVNLNDIGIPFLDYAMPMMEGDRVLVPIRTVFEAFGAEVDWDGKNEIVKIEKGEDKIEIPIGSNEIKKNGAVYVIDVPAKIEEERTFVPLRAVAELMDARVEWEEEPQIVSIYTE